MFQAARFVKPLAFRVISGVSTVLFLLPGSVFSALGEPAGLVDREDTYFETAVAIFHEEPEMLEQNGRKFRVLLQDTETEKVKPKVKTVRATGFFLYHEGDYYFATAQHVAKVLRPDSRVVFVNSIGESRQFVLAKLLEKQEQFVWRNHPEADVSLMQLFIPEKGVAEVDELTILSTDLFLGVPPRTSKLVVAGFPGGLGTRGNKVSPITAVVHLASAEVYIGAELEGISIENAYLVNPPAGKGYSGGPVFYVLPTGEVKCAGMLNGAWSDPTGGKFSISMPARYLFDLLDQ